jgi:erythromycin esterase-like protein
MNWMPLSTPSARRPVVRAHPDGLAALVDAIANARLVLIGEASRGTH